MSAPTSVELADRFHALGTSARVELLALLAVASDRRGRTTMDLTEALGRLTQPTVSNHLRVLRTAGLVNVHREGVHAWWTLSRAAVADLARVLSGLAGDAR